MKSVPPHRNNANEGWIRLLSGGTTYRPACYGKPWFCNQIAHLMNMCCNQFPFLRAPWHVCMAVYNRKTPVSFSEHYRQGFLKYRDTVQSEEV